MIRKILGLIRFSHTVFALPFALLAAAMAVHENLQSAPPRSLRWQDVLGIVLCMVLARAAAMGFNRVVDVEFDRDNPRTAGRHLPSGELPVIVAKLLVFVCTFGFMFSTLLFVPYSRIPVYTSLPVLLFLFAYSFAKRFTALSHFWLGAALMLAPLGAWFALRPEFEWAPFILGFAVMLWVAGFDIIYACQDAEFDRILGLHSVPASLGVTGALHVAAACHGGMILLLLILPNVFPAFGWIYITGVLLIAALLAYEHSLVQPDDLQNVNRAFFHVNAVVSIGLMIAGGLDLFV